MLICFAFGGLCQRGHLSGSHLTLMSPFTGWDNGDKVGLSVLPSITSTPGMVRGLLVSSNLPDGGQWREPTKTCLPVRCSATFAVNDTFESFGSNQPFSVQSEFLLWSFCGCLCLIHPFMMLHTF